jgi:hypothetical protein
MPVQLLLPTTAQFTQVAPPLPQEVRLEGVQVPAWQQPLGHETPSQTHWPLAHRCPARQILPAPQWHCPLDVQVSASVGSHAKQEPGAWPHWPSERAWQTPPAPQQPAGHETGSHWQMPALQWSPLGQAEPN